MEESSLFISIFESAIVNVEKQHVLLLSLQSLSKNCLVHDSEVLQGECLRTKQKFHST